MYLIGSHNKLVNLNHQFGVKIDEHSPEKVKAYGYLGIDLQWSLSWDSPIDRNVKNVSVRSSVPRELDLIKLSSNHTVWLL